MNVGREPDGGCTAREKKSRGVQGCPACLPPTQGPTTEAKRHVGGGDERAEPRKEGPDEAEEQGWSRGRRASSARDTAEVSFRQSRPRGASDQGRRGDPGERRAANPRHPPPPRSALGTAVPTDLQRARARLRPGAAE